MPPAYAQFVEALRTPSQRSAIGLAITDEDAARLIANETWMRDYYVKWIELFPTTGQSVAVPPRSPRVGSVLVIGGLITLCIAVAAVALLLPHPSPAIAVAAEDHPTTKSSASPTPVASNPAGLTTPVIELLNADLAASDSSVDKLIASGTTAAQLQQLAKVGTELADLTCSEMASLPKGFETAGVKDKVVAGMTKGFTFLGHTVTPTPAQADRMWTAIEGYCASKSTPAPTATP